MTISGICNAVSAEKNQCGTIYSFEPTRWRVLADVPGE
jgi:hypothetical protein